MLSDVVVPLIGLICKAQAKSEPRWQLSFHPSSNTHPPPSNHSRFHQKNYGFPSLQISPKINYHLNRTAFICNWQSEEHAASPAQSPNPLTLFPPPTLNRPSPVHRTSASTLLREFIFYRMIRPIHSITILVVVSNIISSFVTIYFVFHTAYFTHIIRQLSTTIYSIFQPKNWYDTTEAYHHTFVQPINSCKP